MTCKGICIRYKASGRYDNGHKRCQVCNIFIKWEGLWCPCCGCKLRTRPGIFGKTKVWQQDERPTIDEDKKYDIIFLSSG